ncbi:phage tail protein [Xenorhabdus griffiniae]|uniref:Phage tail protein n=1 Tax=Xenorhabdus griffiniae TaxID=351672 RepID=A0ABY9XCY1_9GAMM|nr:phage tail protein [Xenorhabdus griffiniae]MBD1229302.1 tail fiber protein [Xenorhabdus griffiniae]MBE8587273.1 tail fiber protein [Xenorhabdus griffiniae]WMV70771.1 phage tail protein [Xenorhabdus griffiniae]WNH00447.1 phage tail protein [Xenorhabdus griffiniae]
MSIQDKKPETQVLEDDGLVVVPTPEYVKDAIEEHAQSRNHPDATLQDKGFVVLSNDAGSDSETMAATPKAVKTAYDLANTATQNASNANENASTRLAKDQNGADIPNKEEFIKNLGLAEGSVLPVGVPVPWPTENPPEGWLICNGDSFDKAKYPKLALAYPSGVLPDLRGEFIRGWDDSGKIDPNRSLLSHQNFAFQNHFHALPTSNGDDGMEENGITTVFDDNKADNFALDLENTQRPVGNNAGLWNGNYFRTYSSSVYGGFSVANETRPRNIAFNYIVRAA